MGTRLELARRNYSMKVFLLGAICWAVFCDLLIWKLGHGLSLFTILNGLPISVGLVVLVWLFCSNITTINQRRLDIEKALWRHVKNEFPALGPIGRIQHWTELLAFFAGTGFVYFSLRFGYYLLSGMTATEMLHTPELLFLDFFLSRSVGVPIAGVLIAYLTGHLTVLAILSKRWQRLAQVQPDQQMAFDALDKLTTLELWQGKTAKADKYSQNPLRIAEQMN